MATFGRGFIEQILFYPSQILRGRKNNPGIENVKKKRMVKKDVKIEILNVLLRRSVYLGMNSYAVAPDQLFHDSRASKSVHRRF